MTFPYHILRGPSNGGKTPSSCTDGHIPNLENWKMLSRHRLSDKILLWWLYIVYNGDKWYHTISLTDKRPTVLQHYGKTVPWEICCEKCPFEKSGETDWGRAESTIFQSSKLAFDSLQERVSLLNNYDLYVANKYSNRTNDFSLLDVFFINGKNVVWFFYPLKNKVPKMASSFWKGKGKFRSRKRRKEPFFAIFVARTPICQFVITKPFTIHTKSSS